MLRVPELTDLLKQHEKFIVSFCVSIVRLTGDEKHSLDLKLLQFIKGNVFPIPLDVFSVHVEKLSDNDIARSKIADSLLERHRLFCSLCDEIALETGREIVNRQLFAMMQDGEPSERAFATMVSACSGHLAAREKLFHGFAQMARTLRWGVLNVLVQLGDFQWMPLFLAALEDPESDVVRSAVMALGRSNTSGAGSKLRNMLQHKDEYVVIAVIRALAALRDPEAPALLIDLAVRTESPRISSAVISALGEFPGPEALDLIVRGLDHHDARNRANAVRALKKKFMLMGRIDEQLIDKIKLLLKDPDHRVRADTIQSLWELGRIESLSEVESLMASQEEGSRTSGAYLCGKLKLNQYKDQLSALTRDSSWNVRKTAAVALLGLGASGAAELQNLLVAGNPDQQIAAAYASGLADDPKGVDWLLSSSRSGTEMAELATSLLLRAPQPKMRDFRNLPDTSGR